MNRSKIVDKAAKVLGVSTSVKEFAFKVLVEQIAQTLSFKKAIRVKELGVFQFKKDTELDINTPEESDYLILSALSSDLFAATNSLYITIPFPTTNSYYSLTDSTINLSENDLKDLYKKIEEKVVLIISRSETLNEFDFWAENLSLDKDILEEAKLFSNKTSLVSPDELEPIDNNLEEMFSNNDIEETKEIVDPASDNDEQEFNIINEIINPKDEDTDTLDEFEGLGFSENDNEAILEDDIESNIEDESEISQNKTEDDFDSDDLTDWENLGLNNGDEIELDIEKESDIPQFEDISNKIDDEKEDTDSLESVFDKLNEDLSTNIDTEETKENDKPIPKPEKTTTLDIPTLEKKGTNWVEDQFAEFDRLGKVSKTEENEEELEITEEEEEDDVITKKPNNTIWFLIGGVLAIVIGLYFFTDFFNSFLGISQTKNEIIQSPVENNPNSNNPEDLAQKQNTPSEVQNNNNNSLFRNIENPVLVDNMVYKSNNQFYKQISSWSEEDKAKKEAEKLIQSGNKSFIIKVYIKNLDKTFFRVNVGFFNTYEEAAAFKVN